MESVYWVFTLRCNDLCAHCYNDSGPRGETISTDELLRVVPNLPDDIGRLILSGGEPTVEMDKLEAIVRAVKTRYAGRVPVWLQTNGDLLDDKRLERLLAMGIDRIDIASLDRFHKQKGAHVEKLRALFEKHGFAEFHFWGANEDFWIGGQWARGRALKNGHALKNPEHNFCAIWSGAIGFLDDGTDKQEVHIQLYRVYPCCPTTHFALGDAREESVAAILDRYRAEPAFQTLNRGDVPSLGTDAGLTPEYIGGRIRALGDVCLWCDEYFEKHYRGPRGERRAAALANPSRPD